MAMGSEIAFSIIVPVLDESETINLLLDDLRQLDYDGEYEIIVVDGCRDGTTLEAIEDTHIKKLSSTQGRAAQMNKGAWEARGEILLFLHADTRFSKHGLTRIEQVMKRDHYVGGAFELGIDSRRVALRIIAYLATKRSRLTRIPYGDQGVFLRREYFEGIGGYREMPLMEDVEIMRRIRKKKDRICILPERVLSSSRRWDREGIVFCTLRNRLLALLYRLGVSPETLAKLYR